MPVILKMNILNLKHTYIGINTNFTLTCNLRSFNLNTFSSSLLSINVVMIYIFWDIFSNEKDIVIMPPWPVAQNPFEHRVHELMIFGAREKLLPIEQRIVNLRRRFKVLIYLTSLIKFC
jgi:hypothetical protein